MTPTVTCVIPVRNGAATIERAVKSAIDAGCDYVMAYDDNSTDDTLHVMLELRARQWIAHEKAPHEVGVVAPSDHWAVSDVLYLPSYVYDEGMPTRIGVNVARNFLITKAPHGLIICLDADDTLHDITPLVNAWEPNTWVYGNQAEVLNEGAKVIYKGAPAGSLARKNITGVTFLFHKDDWQRVGGFDVDFAYAEDFGFQCALTHAGVQPRYVDTVVYDRYIHPEGNERTALAGQYWQFYRDMARRKYPTVFAGTG